MLKIIIIVCIWSTPIIQIDTNTTNVSFNINTIINNIIIII